VLELQNIAAKSLVCGDSEVNLAALWATIYDNIKPARQLVVKLNHNDRNGELLSMSLSNNLNFNSLVRLWKSVSRSEEVVVSRMQSWASCTCLSPWHGSQRTCRCCLSCRRNRRWRVRTFLRICRREIMPSHRLVVAASWRHLAALDKHR